MTLKRMMIGAGSTLALSLVAFPQPVLAGAFYLPHQSVKGTGRAFSGEVADQGPESLWWNPASIAGVEDASGYVGVVALVPSVKARDRGSQIIRPGQPAAPVGGDPRPDNPARFGAAPSLGFAFPVSDRIAVGLSVNSPFGLTTDYDSDSWTRYNADKTKLITLDVQPVVAVKVNDWLRIGAGVNFEYSDATLSIALPNLSAALPDGKQVLTGDGWDMGWSAGVQFVGPTVSAGFSYKSSIDHDLSGSVDISGLLGPLAGSNTRFPTVADFNTPWQAIAGIRVRTSEALTLNAQVTRMGWSEFNRITLTAPPGTTIAEDYRNTWIVAGGADYEVSPLWTVRGGIYYDETPTQNGRRNPSVPDANRIGFNAGVSRAIGRSASIDASIEYIHFKESTLDRQRVIFEGTPVATQVLANGVVSSAHALTFGLGGRFTF